MKIRTVIIDDDFYAAENIKSLVKKNNLELDIIGEANSVMSGIKLINGMKPELVLLDIEMPDGTGFDLLDCFPEYDFNVIFITAYNNYALQAFKFSALAFLEKPVELNEFIEAIEKIREHKLETDSYQNLLFNLKSAKPRKLEIRANEGIYYIDIKDIVHLDSEGRYSLFHTTEGRRLIVTKPLGSYEEILLDKGFFRIHNSHIINLIHVKQFLKKDKEFVIMSNGSTLAISRRKKDQFLNEMKKYTL